MAPTSSLDEASATRLTTRRARPSDLGCAFQQYLRTALRARLVPWIDLLQNHVRPFGTSLDFCMWPRTGSDGQFSCIPIRAHHLGQPHSVTWAPSVSTCIKSHCPSSLTGSVILLISTKVSDGTTSMHRGMRIVPNDGEVPGQIAVPRPLVVIRSSRLTLQLRLCCTLYLLCCCMSPFQNECRRQRRTTRRRLCALARSAFFMPPVP